MRFTYFLDSPNPEEFSVFRDIISGCKYPTNSNQVGLVVLGGGLNNASGAEQIGMSENAALSRAGRFEKHVLGSCSCDVGKKAFYNSGDEADPNFAMHAVSLRSHVNFLTRAFKLFVSYPEAKEDCPEFCIIDEAGKECTPLDTSADLEIYSMPFCAKGSKPVADKDFP